MKAVIYKTGHKLELKDIPKPELRETGAIIRVKGCGLCGSDIVKLKQDLAREGTVPGHEVVGNILEIRGDFDFKPGDRVALGHHVPCFDCVYCKSGNYSMCAEFKKSNIIPGGFAEYIYVSEKHLRHTVFKVPDHLSDSDASFTEPAACCLRAVKRAGVISGDNVLVMGLGSIGLLMGQIIEHFGANAYGCDLLEERTGLAEQLGIKREINGAYDKVFLTAGSASTLQPALNAIRDGGTMLVFSSVPSETEGFPNNQVYYRELTVLGSYSPSPGDLGEALDLISRRIIKVEGLSSIYNLDNIVRAVEDTCEHRIIKAFIAFN